jgi:hypothetical protein
MIGPKSNGDKEPRYPSERFAPKAWKPRNPLVYHHITSFSDCPMAAAMASGIADFFRIGPEQRIGCKIYRTTIECTQCFGVSHFEANSNRLKMMMKLGHSLLGHVLIFAHSRNLSCLSRFQVFLC